MHKNIINIELIEKYLEDKLTGRDLKEFNRRVKEDLSFKILLEEMELVIGGIKRSARSSLQGQLEEIDKQLPEIEIKESKNRTSVFTINRSKKIKPIIRKVIAVAAMLTSAYFISPVHDIVYCNNLYNSNMTVYQDIGNGIHRSGTQIESTKSKAYIAYNNEDYKNAIDLFNKLEVKNSHTLLSMGYSYLAIKDYDSGRKCFKEVINIESLQNNPDSQFLIDNSKWYLAMSYIKTRNKEEAKIILLDLANSNDDYSEKAKKLLKQIESKK